MPWEPKSKMSLREEFIDQVLSNEQTFSSLCEKYGISRNTGYKWLARFREGGLENLCDSSKRPHSFAVHTPSETIDLILATRDQFPAWGARKLREYIIREGIAAKSDISVIPSESTFNRVLKRHHRIEREESNKRKHFIRFERDKPNELWQMDFKGHFKLIEGRCHPLTILDDHSRFSLGIKAALSESHSFVKGALEDIFRTYGLPDQMTMDNGSPWKGSPPWHLSRLTVWLMRLGIIVSHSRPRHPQTQGKDERFHRSLKEEVLRFHQFRDIADAQKHFDEWREVYNNLRPHEGINMCRPVERYHSSARPYPEQLPGIEYEPNDVVRKVRSCGTVSYRNRDYYVGEHLGGEYVALRQTEVDGRIDIYFSNTVLKRLDLRKAREQASPRAN